MPWGLALLCLDPSVYKQSGQLNSLWGKKIQVWLDGVIFFFPQYSRSHEFRVRRNIEDFLSIFAVPYPSHKCSLEEAFLPTLQAEISRANGKDLHERFPKLRIVLEHCSTTAALDAVWNCGPSIVGSFCLLPLTVIVGQRCFHQGRMRWRSEIHSVSCKYLWLILCTDLPDCQRQR